jgi:hypothetical protein
MVPGRALNSKLDFCGDLLRITLDNGAVRAVVLPEIGGKMISLMRVASGREFLLLPPLHAPHPYPRPLYGDLFEKHGTNGFDECLPTIAPCKYPGNGPAGDPLPDHGELWSVPWSRQALDDELLLAGECRQFPMALRKLVFRFDPTLVPCLGIWICQGGDQNDLIPWRWSLVTVGQTRWQRPALGASAARFSAFARNAGSCALNSEKDRFRIEAIGSP